jgi:hypothetical protein
LKQRSLNAPSIVGKTLNAYAAARRRDPALPKPLRADAKVVTLSGRMTVILPLSDGGIVGYSVEPNYTLQRLSPAQLAPFRRQTAERSPYDQLKSLVGQILDRLAVIEAAADRARAETLRAANGHGGNGHVNGAGTGHIPTSQSADEVGGVRPAAG